MQKNDAKNLYVTRLFDAVAGTSFMPWHQKWLSPLRLTVISGADQGKTFLLESGRHTVGRDAKSTIKLTDRSVSSDHAEIEYAAEGCVTVYDRGSMNGISLNGKRKPTLQIKNRQVLQLGGIYIRVEKIQGSASFDLAGRFHTALTVLKDKPWMTTSGVLFFLLSAATFALFAPAKSEEVVNVDFPIIEGSQPVAVNAKPSPKKVSKRNAKNTKLRSRRAVQRTKKVQKPSSLNTRLTAATYEAERALQNGQYPLAYKKLRSILSRHPSHRPALQGINKLVQIANRFYEQALMMAPYQPQQSQKLIAMILQITSPNADVHQRAKQLSQKRRKS